ncbi:MAG: energy transducer TonB [Candidatus Angelobacter sp.]
MKIVNLGAAILLLSSLPCAFGAQSSSPSPTSTPTPAAESPKRPQKIRVSSGVAEGLLLHKVDPKYPREAKKEHIQGTVLLEITIDRQGNVANMKVVQGDPTLADAAMDAVKQWKYKPYILNGEPIEVETVVRIIFHM